MNWFKLSAVLILLITAPLLILTVKAAFESYEQSLRLKTTEGKIITYRYVYNGGYHDDDDRWHPGYYEKLFLIQFATDRGKTIQFETNLSGDESESNIGNKVEVIYDPSAVRADYEASINVPGWSRWGNTVILILLNMAIIIVPIVLFLIGKYVDRRRSIQNTARLAV